MPEIWIYSILSVLAVSLVSLVGVLTLALSGNKLQKLVFLLVALSVGALFGDVFIHIIPEVFESSPNVILTSTYILLGILIFFVLEKFLHWRHAHGCEDEECETHMPGGVAPIGKMVLASDGFHNFIDGVIIGASYLASIPIGIATTLAVILHEIPQEMGHFGILIHSGYSKGKALFYNFVSALFAILGVFVPLLLVGGVEKIIEIVLPIAAGGFIYLAGSDLIPELHKSTDIRKSFSQFVFILVGLGLMYLLLFIE